MKEIVIAKLITGEMVVGSFYHMEKEFLEDVYLIMMMPDGMGSMSMSLAPYMMPFDKYGCMLKSEHIVKDIPATKEVENAYIQATSNILVPSYKL